MWISLFELRWYNSVRSIAILEIAYKARYGSFLRVELNGGVWKFDALWLGMLTKKAW